MGVSNHKCSACKAKLKFNPKSQSWICEYCGSSYTLEDLKNKEVNIVSSNVSTVNKYKEYRCPDCGAEIVMDENTAVTECVYCGNTAIITERLEGEFKPSRVIPFSKTKDEAIKAFSGYGKGKWFMPSNFLRKENIEKITGIYIPFYLYDMIVDGEIDVEAINKQTWSDDEYSYEKQDIYNVIRAGTMSFEKIPTDASKKFSDDIMDSIEPFDYNGLVEFNSSYMSGFLAEKYDLKVKDLLARAEGRAKETTKSVLFSDIHGYSSKKIKSNYETTKIVGKPEYVMLPVWMMNVKYNNKIYTMAMNGQTGKFIGNVPISKIKVAKVWLGIFVLISVIVSLVGLIITG